MPWPLACGLARDEVQVVLRPIVDERAQCRNECSARQSHRGRVEVGRLVRGGEQGASVAHVTGWTRRRTVVHSGVAGFISGVFLAAASVGNQTACRPTPLSGRVTALSAFRAALTWRVVRYRCSVLAAVVVLVGCSPGGRVGGRAARSSQQLHCSSAHEGGRCSGPGPGALSPRGKELSAPGWFARCGSPAGQPTPTAGCGPPRSDTGSACRPPRRRAGGSPRRTPRAATPKRIVAGAGLSPRPSRQRRPQGPDPDRVSTRRPAMVTEPRRTAKPMSLLRPRVAAVDASATDRWAWASGRLDFLSNESRHS